MACMESKRHSSLLDFWVEGVSAAVVGQAVADSAAVWEADRVADSAAEWEVVALEVAALEVAESFSPVNRPGPGMCGGQTWLKNLRSGR
jgi:hypothetical protein